MTTLPTFPISTNKFSDIHFPADLPISACISELKQSLLENQVVIVGGETGSGKSTQLPKLCLSLGLSNKGRIGHTQPRRIAARTLANRIASELTDSPTIGAQEAKSLVACKVRFSDESTKDTKIKLMTDGVLLAEIQSDPKLKAYQTIIIDEAHERSLNIDFLLAYLKRLLPKRKDLKLIVTSATIDLKKFSRHFDDAPIVQVPGKTFPIETRYQPFVNGDNESGEFSEDSNYQVEDEKELSLQVQRALDTILKHGRKEIKSDVLAGDVLVFLASEKEIRELSTYLRKRYVNKLEILPLYGRLSLAEQNKIFQSRTSGRRRVILATNVAETSVTVPRIGYVIDAGKARVSRYSHKSKVQRLPIESISQASANQRMGRCGRIAPGLCIRLYSEEDFLSRETFTEAEIQRTHLAAVILKLETLGLGHIERFPLIDKPDPRLVKDGYKLLYELEAINEINKLTPMAYQLSKLPIEPRLARMIIASNKNRCLSEVLVIACALSIMDPRERPHESAKNADLAHEKFVCPKSDFLSLFKLWQFLESERERLSNSQFRKLCKENFLSFVRVKEWRELHRQLKTILKSNGFRFNKEVFEGEAALLDSDFDKKQYAEIHRSLLSGMLANVAHQGEGFQYDGVRNAKLYIFPASALIKQRAKWIVCSELIHTTKLYGHQCAVIEPEWIDENAKHLLKQNIFEPFWSKKSGRVMAYESLTLYGLQIVAKRQISLAKYRPDECQTLFIRHALIERHYKNPPKWLKANWDQIDEVLLLEDKIRRKDFLVDEESMYQFYANKIPEHVLTTSHLESWYKRQSDAAKKALVLDQAFLLKKTEPENIAVNFPDNQQFNGLEVALSYCFEPSSDQDGVSLNVNMDQLNQLKQTDLEWLVPGLIEEKCRALIKSLPKKLRRKFVPIPETAAKLLKTMSFGEGELLESVCHHLLRMTGVKLELSDFQLDKLDAQYRCKINVYDEQGKLVKSGFDLLNIRESLKLELRESVSQTGSSEQRFEQSAKLFKSWDFGDINQEEVVEKAVVKAVGKSNKKLKAPSEQETYQVKVFPALVDEKEGVRISYFESKDEAENQHMVGQRRLMSFSLSQKKRYLQKNFVNLNKIAMDLYIGGDDKTLFEDVFQYLIDQTFFVDLQKSSFAIDVKRRVGTQTEFADLLQREGDLISNAKNLERDLLEIVKLTKRLRRELSQDVSSLKRERFNAIDAHLKLLIFPGFIQTNAASIISRYPAYLNGMLMRLDRLQGNIEKDIEKQKEISQFRERYNALRSAKVLQSREYRQKLVYFNWMLEEYCLVSFAQGLKTKVSVSAKKLDKLLDDLRV